MLYPQRTQVMVWLWVCILMVFCMVILGGSVRLTGSGLSMVDWKPIVGIIPPISHAAWMEAFDQYRQYPEYKIINSGMALSEFQFIFWMEYLHRVLGRLIGLVFFIPFCFFLLRGGMPSPLKNRLWILLLLGACQGLMGWYMVKSGLVNEPRVSQYRLTAHLMLAVIIFALMLRLAFDLLYQSSVARTAESVVTTASNFARDGGIVVGLILLMITTGGFMAGTHAGHIFNTWPLMGTTLVPDMLLAMQPAWRNLFENTITIQFIHRWMAILVMIAVGWYCLKVLRSGTGGLVALFAKVSIFAVIFQVTLGILTLLGGVPIALGVAHQGSALILLAAVIGVWAAYLRTVTDSRNAESLI